MYFSIVFSLSISFIFSFISASAHCRFLLTVLGNIRLRFPHQKVIIAPCKISPFVFLYICIPVQSSLYFRLVAEHESVRITLRYVISIMAHFFLRFFFFLSCFPASSHLLFSLQVLYNTRISITCCLIGMS